MKAYPISIVLVLSFFLLTACGAEATPTETTELSNIYTAAASTLAAQPTSVPATATQMILASPTMTTFPTVAAATATSRSVVSNVLVSTANGCNDAAYVSDVTIPDGASLAPGEAFVKTWEFQNTGTCAWNEDYLITFVSGTDMEGETTEIDQDVATGSSGDISVSLIAPDSEGTYTGYWRLADEDGNGFGQSVYVMIVVSEDESTLTPTPTPTTETTEATSTPTSAATATSTPTVATSTASPTATSTPTVEPSATTTVQAE